MLINNKELTEYNAKLLNRQILPSEMSINSFWAEGNISPFIDKKVNYKYKTLNLGIEFKGDASEIELNKSRLIKDISISDMEFEKLDNLYSGHVASISTGSKVLGFEVVNLSMLVVEFEKQEIIKTISTADAIVLNSTAETPVMMEIIPSTNMESANIVGLGKDITIKNLTSGQTIIIDGEKGLVTENGENKWLDYDGWGFPKLLPGTNEITTDIPITIRYKPRWL